MTHTFDPTTLREYDIRGIVGETLGPDDARAIGRGFGTLIRRAGGTHVAVGRDGRDSSPMLEEALVEGLNASGCDVIVRTHTVTSVPRPARNVLAMVSSFDGLELLRAEASLLGGRRARR